MTHADAELLSLINRRVASLRPDMAQAMRATFRSLRDQIGAEQAVRLIKAGRINDIITEEMLASATAPLRKQIRSSLDRGFRITIPDIQRAMGAVPNARNTSLIIPATSTRPKQTVNVFFDHLNPRVIDAIRGLEDETLKTVRKESQDVVRAVVEHGLSVGDHPTAIARDLRDAIGLPPSQEKRLRNLAQGLREGDLRVLDRPLLTGRSKAALRKMIEEGKPIPEKRIQEEVDRYRNSLIKANAELNTAQLTRDTYRVARREAYMASIESGLVDENRALKTAVHYDPQEYPRPEHVELNGKTIPINEPWPGEGLILGQFKWGCKCTERYSIRLRPRVAV